MSIFTPPPLIHFFFALFYLWQKDGEQGQKYLEPHPESAFLQFIEKESEQQRVQVHTPTVGGTSGSLHSEVSIIDVHHCHVSGTCTL